jgi:phosphatidylserine/phosphatidylglycerophosphate/cardiolipin synthase-like enzyme
LVCDQTFAMIGSHNFMSSSATKSERELGLKTDNPEIINKLIKLFDQAKDSKIKSVGHPVLKATLN